MVYRKPDGSRNKIYEPGWAGTLGDAEVELLQQALMNDDQLSYWWGFRPRLKRRAGAAIERVAMHGDPENRSHNSRLVREAGRRAKEDNESDSVKVKKQVGGSAPRLGRPRIQSWESTMLKLASDGWGVKRIARQLQGDGVSISHTTVATRLKELRALQLPLVS
jgi:hypothetical protein